jgi:hypothetical protein
MLRRVTCLIPGDLDFFVAFVVSRAHPRASRLLMSAA